MSEVVKIKGLKTGLQLSFAKGASFEDIQADLQNKLESGDKFFIRGTTVFVQKGYFSEERNEKLRRMFHRHGMLFSDELKNPAMLPISKIPKRETQSQTQKTLIVNKTVRGGQEIRAEGSVMIFGNVNPGAQVIAGGNIDIRGTCRGSVHAGAFGDTTACVVADRLMPMQIQIADILARSPDDLEMPDHAEKASIKDGRIVIDAVSR